MKSNLPNTNDLITFNQWWIIDAESWIRDLRAIFVEYRNICHDLQYSSEQNKKIWLYYHAVHLLTKCLSQDCYISPEIRQEIEETLLLPITEIEKRKSNMSN